MIRRFIRWYIDRYHPEDRAFPCPPRSPKDAAMVVCLLPAHQFLRVVKNINLLQGGGWQRNTDRNPFWAHKGPVKVLDRNAKESVLSCPRCHKKRMAEILYWKPAKPEL